MNITADPMNFPRFQDELCLNLLDRISDAILVVDLKGQVTYVNSYCRQLFHIADPDQRNLSQFSKKSPILSVFKTGQDVRDQTMEFSDYYGVKKLLQVSCFKVYDRHKNWQGVASVFRDVTKEVENEEKLRHFEKLAKLGELVSKVCHSIKNPLAIINGYVQLIPRRSSDKDFMKDFTGTVEPEIKRLSSLVKNLLNYARPFSTRESLTDLHQIIQQNVALVKSQAASLGVEIRVDLFEGPCKVKLAPEPFSSAVLEIFLNALQAMPQGGELQVSTMKTPDGSIWIRIKDMGEGIPKEHLQKIYDPFFTTRENGSGLGLSMVKEAIQRSQGRISVKSPSLAKGTEVLINFPSKQWSWQGELKLFDKVG